MSNYGKMFLVRTLWVHQEPTRASPASSLLAQLPPASTHVPTSFPPSLTSPGSLLPWAGSPSSLAWCLRPRFFTLSLTPTPGSLKLLEHSELFHTWRALQRWSSLPASFRRPLSPCLQTPAAEYLPWGPSPPPPRSPLSSPSFPNLPVPPDFPLGQTQGRLRHLPKSVNLQCCPPPPSFFLRFYF